MLIALAPEKNQQCLIKGIYGRKLPSACDGGGLGWGWRLEPSEQKGATLPLIPSPQGRGDFCSLGFMWNRS
jgi:hypothetical protein